MRSRLPFGAGTVLWKREAFLYHCARIAADEAHQYVVWDNGSGDATISICHIAEQCGAEIVREPCNLGLDNATNRLFERLFERYERVCILEDACWPTPGSLTEMAKVLELREDFGIVGISLDCGPQTQHYRGKRTRGIIRHSRAGRLEEAARLVRRRGRRWHSAIEIDPFCFMLKRKCWEGTGQIDEGFWQGWMTMADYCYRARQAGFVSVVAERTFALNADHQKDKLGKPEFRPAPDGISPDSYRQMWAGVGSKRMREKWGDGWENLIRENYKEEEG